jgi:hypothetical protein
VLVVGLLLLACSSSLTFPTGVTAAPWGEFRDASPPLSPLSLPQPIVHIVLGEGIGRLPDTAAAHLDTAVHVVVSIPKYAEWQRTRAVGGLTLECLAEAPLPVEVERGGGEVELLELPQASANAQPLVLLPNAMGRVSFSIPMASILRHLQGKASFIPALLFRLRMQGVEGVEEEAGTPLFPPQPWEATHMDAELLHRLSTLNARALKQAQAQATPERQQQQRPGLRLLHAASADIQDFCRRLRDRLHPHHGAHAHPLREGEEEEEGDAEGSRFAKRGGAHPATSSPLAYDDRTNQVTSYPVRLPAAPQAGEGSGPIAAVNHFPLRVQHPAAAHRRRPLQRRDTTTPPPTAPEWRVDSGALESFQNSSDQAIGKLKKWMVYHESRASRFTSAIESRVDHWIDLAADSVSKAWVIISLVLSGLGAAFEVGLPPFPDLVLGTGV